MAEHLPADGKQWMNSLFCFACVHSFCFTYSTVFNSTHTFSHFYSPSSLPHPISVGDQASGCVVFSCQQGLNHDIHVLTGLKFLSACPWAPAVWRDISSWKNDSSVCSPTGLQQVATAVQVTKDWINLVLGKLWLFLVQLGTVRGWLVWAGWSYWAGWDRLAPSAGESPSRWDKHGNWVTGMKQKRDLPLFHNSSSSILVHCLMLLQQTVACS